MKRSTTRPYGKWYESGYHLIFGYPQFTVMEMELLRAEHEQDEQERVRAADMMADKFVDEIWPLVEVTILLPVGGFSSWDVIKHKYERRDEFRNMLREFWREKV